jgi:hypothetical protein
MSNTRMILIVAAAASALIGTSAAFAQGRGAGDGSGPVGTACAKSIARYCADAQHGNRGVRNCLEAKRSKLPQACKAALDGTGGGRGRR